MACGTLHAATLELVLNRPRALTFAKLSEELNVAGHEPITDCWLEQFARSNIKRPPVDRIQRIYEHLSGKTLDI
jgi:hypothetical protein